MLATVSLKPEEVVLSILSASMIEASEVGSVQLNNVVGGGKTEDGQAVRCCGEHGRKEEGSRALLSGSPFKRRRTGVWCLPCHGYATRGMASSCGAGSSSNFV